MSLTPEQFNKIALKEDLDRLENKVDINHSELSGKLDSLLNIVDGIAKNYENHQVEHAANIGAHDRFEVRIAKLEESVTN